MGILIVIGACAFWLLAVLAAIEWWTDGKSVRAVLALCVVFGMPASLIVASSSYEARSREACEAKGGVPFKGNNGAYVCLKPEALKVMT